jgi:hypothetical protein
MPPLVDKGCSYKKVVNGYNAAGNVVEVDDGPGHSLDKYNRRIVSYDKGRSWDLVSEVSPPNMRVERVEIEWVREEK